MIFILWIHYWCNFNINRAFWYGALFYATKRCMTRIASPWGLRFYIKNAHVIYVLICKGSNRNGSLNTYKFSMKQLYMSIFISISLLREWQVCCFCVEWHYFVFLTSITIDCLGMQKLSVSGSAIAHLPSAPELFIRILFWICCHETLFYQICIPSSDILQGISRQLTILVVFSAVHA